MAPLTRHDLRRHAPFAWACMAALLAVAVAFHFTDRTAAAEGTLAALAGCLGLALPPRERMGVLPPFLRRLPRRLDAVPALMALLASPGYGLNWFYGANAFDEVVHLVNGMLAGLVLGEMLGVGVSRARRLAIGAAVGLVVGVGWEAFEWAARLIGDWPDTLSDIALTAAGLMLGTMAGRPRGRTG